MSSGLACIILAGGASRRMGVDKRRLQLWGAAGPTLLEHVLAIAGQLCAERIVVLNDPADWPTLDAQPVADAYPDAGPLGGLASGLAAMRAEKALLLACDLPLLRVELLAGVIASSVGYDAALPVRLDHAHGPRNRLAVEPLLAVYARSSLAAVEACLQRGERRMTAPLAQLRVNTITPAIWQQWDPEGLSFLNLNHPDDLAAVVAYLANTP